MRSRRIDLDTMHIALSVIETMEVRVHYNPYTSRNLIEMAGHYHLQVADALYFHLAKVLRLPIATLDGGLRTAAKTYGVKLFAA